MRTITGKRHFRTDNRALVEEYCERNHIHWKWTLSGLQTEQVQDAIVFHPKTGEPCWFNHAFIFNVGSFEPADMREVLAASPEYLSTSTYFGDGSEIAGSVISEIRQAYWEAAIALPWEEGDILLIDNMLTAHAREAFSGSRQIMVAMVEGIDRTQLPVGTVDRAAFDGG